MPIWPIRLKRLYCPCGHRGTCMPPTRPSRQAQPTRWSPDVSAKPHLRIGDLTMTVLDHKLTADVAMPTLTERIDDLAHRLDQTHPLQRKIQFLLDVRGYLKVNALSGSYVEFGSFRSEMQYA